MMPLSLAPGWLLNVADLNLLAYTVDTALALLLLAGNLSDAVVLCRLAITTVLALLVLWWAARLVRQATA